MNHLLRGLAPLTDAAWKAIDDEARMRLTTNLAARKLVDFRGPHGWEHSATSLGRTSELTPAPSDAVAALTRTVLPLIELRVPFSLDRAELFDIDRGAQDVDLSSLGEAAREMAIVENSVVFHGYPEAGVVGIIEASSHPRIPLGTDTSTYPRVAAKAVALLRNAGVSGPFGLAIEPDAFTAIIETAQRGGYLLLHHLRHILDGPVVRAPGVRGGVVLSQRKGDFIIESGQDLSIGYAGHTTYSVDLYLEQSLSFQVTQPDAAVALEPSAS